jgi:DNA repair ATPase RecN
MWKLAGVLFKNFGLFELFEVKFGETITRLVGRNGAGKSMVGLKGLMACLNGISENSSKGQLVGERFRFIGKAGASADISYTFKDSRDGSEITMRNHITKQGNDIHIKSNSDVQIDDTFLKDFLNVNLMSAKHFCGLSGQDQARALGIDVRVGDIRNIIILSGAGGDHVEQS